MTANVSLISKLTNSEKTKRFLVRLGVIFIVLCVLSAAHRYFAIRIYMRTSDFDWHVNTGEGLNPVNEFARLYWREILLGVKSDVLFSAMGAIVLAFIGRIGAVVGVIAISFFYSANHEHLRFNDSSIDLAYLGLALDPTFIQGQTTPKFLAYAIASTLLGLGLLVLSRWRPLRLLALGIAPIIACILAIPAAANLGEPIWLQSHPLAPKIGNFAAETDTRDFKVGSLIDNNPPLDSFAGQHNVLLVFIEGISEHSLSKANMQNLLSLADKNLHFEQYIGHQMITANGLYATHTGLQPYVTGVSMRWYGITPTSPETQTALPQVLRNAGYQTNFVQAAPLAYMNKAEKLTALGYDNVIGDESFDTAYSRNAWGVDDLTLMEGTLAQIDKMNPNKPWLTTVLTTSTHSPYNTPPNFEPEAINSRTRAISYADQAIGALMVGLEDRGLLENTVVIITADEARETAPGSALAGEILRNWLPLIVIHPDDVTMDISDPFSMIDLRNLILMLTGDFDLGPVQALIDQRDVFVFGNVRLDRMFYFDRSDQVLFACNTDDFICNQYEDANDIRELDQMRLVGTSQFPVLQTLVKNLENGATECERGYDPALC